MAKKKEFTPESPVNVDYKVNGLSVSATLRTGITYTVDTSAEAAEVDLYRNTISLKTFNKVTKKKPVEEKTVE